jgi:hypothetical protein
LLNQSVSSNQQKMQRIVCFLAVVVAIAFAQSPQNGPLTPTIIASGQFVQGNLPATTEAAAYHVDLYQIFIPENATNVNVTFVNQNEECDYINLYVRNAATGGLPCAEDDYDPTYYSCATTYSIDDGIGGTYYYNINPYVTEDLFEWSTNQNWYFGVGRYSSSYSDDACAYTLQVTVNASCPTGSVGNGYYEENTCSGPYVNVAAVPYYNNISSNSDSYDQLFKVNIPTADVGHIFIQINSSYPDLYLYGKNYGSPTDEQYNCEVDDYTYSNGDDFYYYDLYCYTPRIGDFFIEIISDEAFNASLKITYLTCPSGFGGYNCTFQSVPLNTSVQTFQVPYAGLTYGFAYVYVDIPGNYSGGNIEVHASSGQEGEMIIRFGGYPEDSSDYGYLDEYQYQELPASFILNNFDTFVAGRWYFGLECDASSTGCTIAVSQNTSSTSGPVTTAAPSTTSHVSTTGSTSKSITSGTTTSFATTTGRFTSGRATTARATTAQATTGAAHTSPASIIAPSIVAALFALLALF